MNAIKKIWRRISHLGVERSTRFAEAKFIIQTNQISLIASLLGLSVFFNYWTNGLRMNACLQIVTILFFLTPLLLNKYKKFRFSKVTLIFSANVSSFLSSSMLGYDSGEHYAYFALMIVTLIIFDRKEKLFMLFFSVLSGLCLIALELTNYSIFLIPDLPDHLENSLYLGNISATIIIILLAINYFRNISDQHIDTIIQKTHEELKAIFDNSHDAIFILEPSTKIITGCNDRALQIFNIPACEDVVGVFFYSLYKNFSDISSDMKKVYQHVLQHKSWSADEEFTTKDGRVFWGNLALTWVELEDKNLLIARITDITENKQISILLENLTHDLKKVQHIVKLGYWHLEVGTRLVTYCSEEVGKQFSLPEDFSDMSFDAFVTDVYSKDLANLKEAIDQSITTQTPFELEFRVGKNDNVKWIYTKSDLVVDDEGRAIKIICTSLDITERKKAEEKLKISERNYRKLASNIPDTDIFLFDSNMQIIVAEGTIMQKHGLNSNFFEGKPIDKVLDGAYKEHVKSLFEAVLKGEKVSSDIALDSEFLNMRGVPLRDANNQISGGLMVSQDITTRKKDEQELIKAKEEAERASMAKAQFLSTMSHELRTPLNAVIGMAHLLLQEEPKPEQIENLHLLRFSAENLLALINDILDFSKIEAGKVELEEIEFSLNSLLNSLIRSFKLRAEEKKLKLELNVPKEIPGLILGDPTRLSQIMNNLISNAIKFTNKGGVSVSVEVEEQNEEQVKLLFLVKDTGLGIPEEKTETIFEQFSQADSNTTRRFGGTGLGLAITKKLLKLQNSDIKVSSKINKGSVFSFNLTFRIGNRQNMLLGILSNFNSVSLEKSSLKGFRVLLVEDNQTNVIIATKFMKKWELEYEHAENGQIAVEKVRNHRYDLILMDLQMPVMDGYQAAKEIRKYNQETPIIALTASAMVETKAKVKKAGMNEIVTKPFDPTELFNKLLKWTAVKTGINS